MAPEIRVLTYPFENKWVSRHQARERVRSKSDWLDAAIRSSILGIEPRFLSGLDRAASEQEGFPDKQVALDIPVFKLEERVARRSVTQPQYAARGEDSREALLVQFFGGCYALLTEWAELPVLNELIDNRNGENAKFTSATASRLSVGDFVLFRAGGDKEFIRLIAEEGLGTKEYRQIRDVAERWKAPLHDLGGTPTAVQRCLEHHGLFRTLPTVAGWLGNPDRIGPGASDDIEAIATAAGDADLLSRMDEVTDAISRIRGAHLAAGTQLTKLIFGELHGRTSELGDQPTLLDLGYGQAWVVLVASVDTKRREYRTSDVNRLLWTADGAF